MIKRIVFIFLAIILTVSAVCGFVKVSTSPMPPEDDIFETPGWVSIVFPWVLFLVCEFEIFYNILYFFVYKRKDSRLESRLNIVALIVAFLSFVWNYGLLSILMKPLLLFVYVVIRVSYLVAFYISKKINKKPSVS